VKQLLTSVVREICMLRSVGAGERETAPGHPVAISDGRPYRDSDSIIRLRIERGMPRLPKGEVVRSQLEKNGCLRSCVAY
jgi:hypothetical protein